MGEEWCFQSLVGDGRIRRVGSLVSGRAGRCLEVWRPWLEGLAGVATVQSSHATQLSTTAEWNGDGEWCGEGELRLEEREVRRRRLGGWSSVSITGSAQLERTRVGDRDGQMCRNVPY
jgi:hypothetical protein